MIRMALEGAPGVQGLAFDLPGRTLVATHAGDAADVLARLEPLGLGARLSASEPLEEPATSARLDRDAAGEARVLRALLAINVVMFVLELAVGWLGESTALLADSLDMFADATVYGMALYAVGRSPALKVRAAHAAGWLQACLALGAVSEVARRFLFGSEPESALMIGMGLVALAANVTCLWLVAGRKEAGAHMRASTIFSANDLIANAGVILAGVLVAWSGSPYPDLVIGVVVATVVLHGAGRILKLR